MPFFSPGSSEQSIAPPAPSPAIVDKLAELSVDEPLPESYRADRIRLLAQSPRRLYLYWELKRDPFETLQRAFGSRAGLYALVVRLTALADGGESLHAASPTRSQWFDVRPDNSYRADLGLYSRGRAFIRLLSSNVAQTPRAGVARAVDPTPEFRVEPEEFARVLDDAGYAADALEVTLEAADATTDNSATLAVARRFAAMDAPALDEKELA
ncbi:MAG TPA: DUF4912 domain-containing protein, partial [Pyrinomonadaceae bacterium]